jgi:hypothetical protein
MKMSFASADGRFTRNLALSTSALLWIVPAQAQDAPHTQFPFSLDGAYHEIESKYIFGFTDGSDIGAEGEIAIETDTNAAFRRRHGVYNAVEQEIELEGTPTQFFAYELSLHGFGHSIQNDDQLADLHRVSFGGFSTNLRYLLLGRGPESPIGLIIMAEPEWARVEGDSGQHTRSMGVTFKVLADTELIENHLYAAANLIYEPGIAKAVGDPAWAKAASMGVTAAMTWRLTPKVAAGGEIEYYRAYDSLGFKTYQGDALYLGPTFHVQVTKKMILAGAFSAQVAGHTAGDDRRLNLVDFSRYRARLRMEYEF